MTFENLFDLIKNHRFENDTDKKIAVKIFEAERDWKTSPESLNDFIAELEKEAGETVTNTSLKKLLKKYNQNLSKYAWEAESMCSLLEIYELTEESELRNIFSNIANKNKTD